MKDDIEIIEVSQTININNGRISYTEPAEFPGFIFIVQSMTDKNAPLQLSLMYESTKEKAIEVIKDMGYLPISSYPMAKLFEQYKKHSEFRLKHIVN